MPSKPLTPLRLLLDVFLLDCRARRLRPTTLTFYRQQITYLIDYATANNATEAAHISTHDCAIILCLGDSAEISTPLVQG